MGYYIEVPQSVFKADQLIDLYKAEMIIRPKSFSDVPSDKALICVMSNAMFDAAALCFSEKEFEAFSDPNDYRPKTWLIMDKALAHKLTGFKESSHAPD